MKRKIVGVEIDEVDVEIIKDSLELFKMSLSDLLDDLAHEINNCDDSVEKVSELATTFAVRKRVIKLLQKINDATAN